MNANFPNGGPSRHHFRFSIDVYKAEIFEVQTFLGYKIGPNVPPPEQSESHGTNLQLEPYPTKRLRPASQDPWNSRIMKFLGFCFGTVMGLFRW